ncbi:MAG: HAD-IIIA family hydrolase [Phycisphaerales bacterium]|nr:HAD-IIIA family hydrolase [Planctomycetota bacterium]
MKGRSIDTVFLDRDGTINVRLVGEWITRPDQFVLLPGAGPALARLRDAGMRLIVATNQRGIELGRFTEAELDRVHDHMRSLLRPFGVELDAVYYSVPAKGPRTKPEPGMLCDAKRDFPSIDFSRSVMIGDAVRDIQAGLAVGCGTVLIADEKHGPAVLAEAREKLVSPHFVVSTIEAAAEQVLNWGLEGISG